MVTEEDSPSMNNNNNNNTNNTSLSVTNSNSSSGNSGARAIRIRKRALMSPLSAFKSPPSPTQASDPSITPTTPLSLTLDTELSSSSAASSPSSSPTIADNDTTQQQQQQQQPESSTSSTSTTPTTPTSNESNNSTNETNNKTSPSSLSVAFADADIVQPDASSPHASPTLIQLHTRARTVRAKTPPMLSLSSSIHNHHQQQQQQQQQYNAPPTPPLTLSLKNKTIYSQYPSPSSVISSSVSPHHHHSSSSPPKMVKTRTNRATSIKSFTPASISTLNSHSLRIPSNNNNNHTAAATKDVQKNEQHCHDNSNKSDDDHDEDYYEDESVSCDDDMMSQDTMTDGQEDDPCKDNEHTGTTIMDNNCSSHHDEQVQKIHLLLENVKGIGARNQRSDSTSSVTSTYSSNEISKGTVWRTIEDLKRQIERKEHELGLLKSELKFQCELYLNMKDNEIQIEHQCTEAQQHVDNRGTDNHQDSNDGSGGGEVTTPRTLKAKQWKHMSVGEFEHEFTNPLYDPRDTNRIVWRKFEPQEDTLFTYYESCHDTLSLTPLLSEEYNRIHGLSSTLDEYDSSSGIVDENEVLYGDLHVSGDSSFGLQVMGDDASSTDLLTTHRDGTSSEQFLTAINTSNTSSADSISPRARMLSPRHNTEPTVEILRDDNGEVRAATLSKLVFELTNHQSFDNEFLHIFLLTYRSFMSPYQLLAQLTARYNLVPPFIEAQAAKLPMTVSDFSLIPIQYPEDMNAVKDFIRNTLTPTRLRVCQVVKTWLQNHFTDFRNDEKLSQYLRTFFSMLKHTHMSNLSQQLKQIWTNSSNRRDTFSTQQVQELLKQNALEESATKKHNAIESLHMYKKVVSGDKLHEQPLYKFKTSLLAQELTMFTFDIFKAILPRELLNQNWTKPNRHLVAPNIIRMISRSNMVGAWVATEILNISDLEERAKLIKRFIKLASKLDKINNFNTLVDVVSGLTCNPVHRLTKTWTLVSERKKIELQRLQTLVDPRRSYVNLRNAMKERGPPCIPALGIYLTDVTFIEDGNKDEVQGLINFFKKRLLGSVIRDLQTIQNTPYTTKGQPLLLLRSRLIKLPAKDMKELYDISVVHEPQKKTTKKIVFD